MLTPPNALFYHFIQSKTDIILREKHFLLWSCVIDDYIKIDVYHFLSMRLFSKVCHSSLHKASVIIDNNVKLLFLTFVCWLAEDYLVAIVNVRKNMYFAKRLSDLLVCRCVWNFFERSCTAKYIFSLIIHIIRISWCTLGSMSLIYFNIRFAWYNLRISKYSLRFWGCFKLLVKSSSYHLFV